LALIVCCGIAVGCGDGSTASDAGTDGGAGAGGGTSGSGGGAGTGGGAAGGGGGVDPGECGRYTAADSVCGGAMPPNAYRCVFPAPAPANCTLRQGGDVTTIYCCP